MINIGRGKICRDFHPLNINNIFIHSKYSKFFFPFHLLISTRVETSDEKLHHFLPQLPFTLTPVMRRKRGSPPFPMILAVKVSRGRELVAPSITRITRPSRPKDDLVQGETQRGSRQGMRDRRGRGQCRTGYWRDFGLLLFPFEEKNRRRTILSLFLLRRERETRSPHLAARKTLAHADFTSRKNKGSSLAAFYRARKYVLFIEIYSIIRI